MMKRVECVQSSGGDDVGRGTRLGAVPSSAAGRWLTSSDNLRLTGEEGIGGDWASKSGGSG